MSQLGTSAPVASMAEAMSSTGAGPGAGASPQFLVKRVRYLMYSVASVAFGKIAGTHVPIVAISSSVHLGVSCKRGESV